MKTERPQAAGPNANLLENPRRTADSDGRRTSSEVLAADVRAFEEELARERPDEEESTHRDGQQGQPSATPFEPLPSASPSIQAEHPLYAKAQQCLLDTVQQLWVSETWASNRQVCVSFAEDVLPGVTLSVFEDGGRIVAEFVCTAEPSRAWLSQYAQRLARGLANSLNRQTRLCVRTDDPDDPCFVQVDGAPPSCEPLSRDGNSRGPWRPLAGSGDA